MEIEMKLDLLQSDSEDLFDNLINKIKELTFNDKDNIIMNYEHSLFHDIGREIGFFRQNIILLYNYLQFRIKYDNFSDEVLKKIIDNEITIFEKKEIFMGNNAKEIVERIKEIKREWSKVFRSATYKKIKEKLKLDELIKNVFKNNGVRANGI